MVAKDESVLDNLVKSLEDGPEQFQLTDEGSIENYLRVEIKDNADGSLSSLSLT